MLVRLSHDLHEDTPSYPGTPPIRIRPLKQISRSDSSNTYLVELPNHIGTHIDTPNHFDPRGRKIAEFNIDELVFEKPLLIDIGKGPGELFAAEDFQPFKERIAESDFLLIRTGFETFRTKDPETYARKNPGFSPEAAKQIVEDFPQLRGMGFDLISLSSVEHREEGRAAHRQLLVGRDFVIVEDMRLSELTDSPKRLFVVPVFLDGVDGMPCTVIAES
jgi:kynurenine formamidase